MARVLPYPWSLFASRSGIGASLSLEDRETVEPFNPEALTFFTRTEDEALPKFAGHRANSLSCVSETASLKYPQRKSTVSRK
jgi:hypothetical protein